MQIRLEASRLIISPISLADLGNIHELHSLPETDEFNTLGIPKNMDETKTIINDWIKNQEKEPAGFTLKIELADTGQFIGLIALNQASAKFRSAEIWYKLLNIAFVKQIQLLVRYSINQLGLLLLLVRILV